MAVSYTHLDVYKRQLLHCFFFNVIEPTWISVIFKYFAQARTAWPYTQITTFNFKQIYFKTKYTYRMIEFKYFGDTESVWTVWENQICQVKIIKMFRLKLYTDSNVLNGILSGKDQTN